VSGLDKRGKAISRGTRNDNVVGTGVVGHGRPLWLLMLLYCHYGEGKIRVTICIRFGRFDLVDSG